MKFILTSILVVAFSTAIPLGYSLLDPSDLLLANKDAQYHPASSVTLRRSGKPTEYGTGQ